MTWKIISMVLPDTDEEVLTHLSSFVHSWTVDHDHSNCGSEIAVCHAASHEYGPSSSEDGTNQHQHFIGN